MSQKRPTTPQSQPSTILYTTDFSLRAKFGLIIAAHIAMIFQCKLVICHVHGPLSMKELNGASAQNKEAIINEKHFTQKELLHRSLKELGELEIFIRKRFQQLETRTEFRESSDVAGSINKIATKQQANLIVFSTKVREGGTVLGGKIIRSLKVEHPMLIIPIENALLGENADEWKWDLREIVYLGGIGACKPKEVHEDSLKQLEQWKEHAATKVTLKVLHVASGANEKEALEQESRTFLEEHSLVDDCVLLQAADSNAILDTIAEYVRENRDVSMIAVTKKKRSFLGSLLHKSVTKEVVNDVNIPVLIFHE